MYTVSMILFALCLVALNGFFVAAEFSFVKVRKTQLELLASAGNRKAKSALFGVTHLDAYLSVCQLGITLASLGLGWIGEPAVASMLLPVLEFAGITTPAVVSSLSFAIGFSIITLLHVVFGELAPKSISIQKAETCVLLLAVPMRIFYVVCLPIVSIMNGISNAVLRLVGMHTATEVGEMHSPEELRMLIEESSRSGRMNEDEGRLLDNIFSFYHKTAKDIMLHRIDVIAFDITSSVDDLLQNSYESGHTRYPVYEDNRDNIIGFVHVRDATRHRHAPTLKGIVRAPLFAHETLHLNNLLSQMQAGRQQFCIVIDEYGVWQGILTMEDVLESIVGDIQDEFDNEEQEIVDQGNGVYSISAGLSLDELAEVVPLDCAGEDSVDMYKIIAAHFAERLERIPEAGDSIELCGNRFTVMAMDRNRIKRLTVVDASPEEKPDEPGTDSDNGAPGEGAGDISGSATGATNTPVTPDTTGAPDTPDTTGNAPHTPGRHPE